MRYYECIMISTVRQMKVNDNISILTIIIGGLLFIARYHHEVWARQHSRSGTVYLRDKILEWQCRAKCESTVTRFDNCLKQCQKDMIKSPRRGHCPFNTIFRNMNTPLHELSCLDNCYYDYDCPEVQKCCYTSCGPVCAEPWGIREDNLLPPIPKIEEYTLISREKKVEINSTINLLHTNSTYFFHVESRYHIGLFLRPRKFGAWQYQAVDKIAELRDYNSKLFNTKVEFRLRPGRWYQVRVAAINAYGFRGYSEPSQAFTLPNHPKPPKKPADLKVVSSYTTDGNYYTVNIVWCPSKSNLPIEKYKIIWALYVKSMEESFIYNESYVKDRHNLEITNLLPDSSYYIQVQAIVINGRKRLKSEPCSLLYNTTYISPPSITSTIATIQAYGTLRCDKDSHNMMRGLAYNTSPSHKLLPHHYNTQNFLTNNSFNINSIARNTIELKYCFNRKSELIVNISGLSTKRGKIYELCPQETNCEEYSAIRAMRDHLVFNKLNYNTTYTLRPRFEMHINGSMKIITFTVPSWDYIRKDCLKRKFKCCKTDIKHLK